MLCYCYVIKTGIMVKNDATNLLKGTLKFPAGGLKAKVAGGVASIFAPMISIFIGLPSSCTLLYLLTAAIASDLLEKITSAVPCQSRGTIMNT